MHALEVRGLVDRILGVKALDGVDLVARQHEVLGLVGENGAGKSTLLKALVGLVRPDAGQIWVRGGKVRLRSVAMPPTTASAWCSRSSRSCPT